MSNRKKRRVNKLRKQAMRSSRPQKLSGELARQVTPAYQGKRVKGKARDRIFARDGGCYRCGWKEGLTVHHVLPKRMGGTNHEENLVSLCEGCHHDWNAAENSGDWAWAEFYDWVEST